MGLMALTGPLLRAGADINKDAFVEDARMRGAKVARFRRYRDGDFDAQLTTEMRKLLRLRTSVNDTAEFGINYCDTTVTTLADRLIVEAIESEDEQLKEFIKDVARVQRLDGLQIDVHESALTDADTFLMVDWDNEKGRVRWTHELAYDGTEGVIPVYRRSDKREMFAAVKIWQETRNTYADTYRINVYYADRIERYEGASAGGSIRLLGTDVWDVGMCPVVVFPHKARGNSPYGVSKLEKVVPLQDALNRVLHSMIMASELSAFQIRYVVGMKAPQALTPGMFLDIYPKDASGSATTPTEEEIAWLNAVRFGSFEQGNIDQFLAQARFIIEQIHDITNTPRRGTLSSNASGEALKQDEIGLLSEVRRAQVKFGNSWEKVAELSVAVANVYGNARLPQDPEFFTNWADAEVRDDAGTLDMALKVEDLFGADKTIELAAKAFNLDASEIEAIKAAREREERRRRQDMAFMGVNRFGQGGGQPPNGQQDQQQNMNGNSQQNQQQAVANA